VTRIQKSAPLALIVCAVSGIIFVGCGLAPTPAQNTANSCVQLRSEMDRLSCGGTVAYDWGELGVYREADLRQPAPSQGLSRVVFIGDSITFAWPDLEAPGRFPGLEGVNRGITGQVTAQMLLRFRQDVINLHPKIVVILAGTNDLSRVLPPRLPVIEGNLASMVQLAKANGIQTVLSSILPITDYERDPNGRPYIQTKAHSPQEVRELNKWLGQFAAENGCVFLDYYSALADEQGFLRRGYSYDGLHPNAAGYSVMDPPLRHAISAALRK
jgi:lysophospholipase L1-like esterase